MAITPMYANLELANGTVLSDLRVTYADRVRAEKTAKARGWDPNHDNVLIAGFIAWAAAQRLGHINQGYEEFINELVDAQVTNEASNPAQDDEDPTQTDPLDI